MANKTEDDTSADELQELLESIAETYETEDGEYLAVEVDEAAQLITSYTKQRELALLERLENVLPPINRLEVGDEYNNGYTDAESYYDVAIQKEKELTNDH